jgi:hypothetical protein
MPPITQLELFIHLPCPVLSPGLNIIEPVWSLLETTVKNTFAAAASVKHLTMFFKKNGVKFR